MMTPKQLQDMHRAFVDSGKLIEAGWISMRMAAIPPNAPQIQLDVMRSAFMAGAQHVFASIMQMLDPGDDPTDADMRRISLISAELELFGKELVGRLRKAGHA